LHKHLNLGKIHALYKVDTDYHGYSVVSIRSEIAVQTNHRDRMKLTATRKQDKLTGIPKVTKSPTRRSARTETIIRAKQDNPALTTRQIAKIADCDHSNVVKTLQRYSIEHERVERYKDYRADILAGLQEQVLHSFTGSDWSKTSTRDRAVVFGILHDHERLERGKATQITQSIQYILSQIEYEDKTSGKHPANITPQVGSQTHPDNTSLISVEQA
jgi:hypothetical protein